MKEEHQRARVSRIFDRTAKRMRVRGARLEVRPDVDCLAFANMLTRVVVVSGDLLTWPAWALEAVFAHELGHLRDVRLYVATVLSFGAVAAVSVYVSTRDLVTPWVILGLALVVVRGAMRLLEHRADAHCARAIGKSKTVDLLVHVSRDYGPITKLISTHPDDAKRVAHVLALDKSPSRVRR